jgi:hypothetical protein
MRTQIYCGLPGFDDRLNNLEFSLKVVRDAGEYSCIVDLPKWSQAKLRKYFEDQLLRASMVRQVVYFSDSVKVVTTSVANSVNNELYILGSYHLPAFTA